MAANAGWVCPRKGPFGGTAAGMGPLEEVNWAMLLALIVVFFWAIRKCRKRNPEEEQRAVAAENRRKAPPLQGGVRRGGLLRDSRSGRRRVLRPPRSAPRSGGFTRSVASLRRTFPDLRVSAEEQSVQGDAS
jgi:hypothetical protein